MKFEEYGIFRSLTRTMFRFPISKESFMLYFLVTPPSSQTLKRLVVIIDISGRSKPFNERFSTFPRFVLSSKREEQ